MSVSSDGSKRQPKSVLQINERFGSNRRLLKKQKSHTCASTNYSGSIIVVNRHWHYRMLALVVRLKYLRRTEELFQN